ncbi:MAG: aminopeptidase P family protein [Muribaculaceae bacterium]|nr:aminopeptidase P family protein [Muribaculaceae bacterium]
MANIHSQRIEALRRRMEAEGIDAVIIPQADPHMSEYIASRWQARRWFSGFTGSAGDLVVTPDQALLWTDSRYFLQAARQLEDSGIQLMKDGLASTPSIPEYLLAHPGKHHTVAVDALMFSIDSVDALRDALAAEGIALRTDFDAAEGLWTDRPALPDHKLFLHSEEYAGASAASKLDMMRSAARERGAHGLLFSALDEVAWLLNIRSADVKHNPVAISYLYVDATPEGRATLFVAPSKMTAEVETYLSSQGVDIKPYDSLADFLRALPADIRVMVEAPRTTGAVRDILGSRAMLVRRSPASLPKACKNDVQIAGIRRAMIRDGVAMCRSLREIEDRMSAGIPTTEIDVAEILRRQRSISPAFFDESFGTIAGYGPHGAIVHYEATPETSSTLRPEGLLLIDSGAQYPDATTDLTRTICLGTPTPEERHDFTLVMKGHIALARMIFPDDTRGAQLDAIARQFLWHEGMSYLHGTGHGVGQFLGCHEGPQSIRLNYVDVALQPGMIISNEPGVYKEGVHGIRCENLVLCVPAMTTEFGRFLKFETLTLCPFEPDLFETEIMTDDELRWLNDYQTRVRETLTPELDPLTAQWLTDKTRTIERKK